MKNTKKILHSTLLIGIGFLWTGCGYLTWLYRLLDFYDSTLADLLSEGVGYLFQALGILLVALLIKKNVPKQKKLFVFTIILEFICMLSCGFINSSVAVLILGFLMNLFCGCIAGYYLSSLVLQVPQQRRGITFGFGYAIGCVGTWLVSLIGGENSFLKSPFVFILYALFAVVMILMVLPSKDETPSETALNDTPFIKPTTSLIAFAGIIVVVLSIIKNVGFYFPTADMTSGAVSLEFTRLFYGLGLILAGFLNDWNRKYGAIFCVASLIFPFLLLFLQGEATASALLWIIGYVFFGFFSVYRVVVFADLAGQSSSYLWLAGFGLLFGRLGDVLGAVAGMTIKNQTVLITCGSVLFIITIFLIFEFFQRMYFVGGTKATDESLELIDPMKVFIEQYELSSREKDVFEKLLQGLSNSEIATQLFISENTVKFHIRNLLKKTSCSNRAELIKLFEQI